MHKKLVVVFFLLFFFSSVFAVLENGSMKIFAVTTEGNAVSADLFLSIRPGTGQIWSNVNPLVGTTTQNAERVALKLASNYSNQTNNLDFFFDIDSDASIVEGPSAGAAMALLTISMLQDKVLNKEVGITGTISEHGQVGPVGGVYAKSEEANRIGLKLFMIPKGEARQVIKEGDLVTSVNLVNYAAENWSAKIIEVSNIDEVLNYAFSEVEKIDVNSTEENSEIKEFLPESLPDADDLIIMKNLSKRMLDEAKVTFKGAKNALSNTSIQNDSDISFLLVTLNSAEQSLMQGETLYEKNYLYSAANNIFIAKVYASLVKDVAENPSILASDSKLFDLKIDNLKKNIDGLKENLDSFVPLDFIEWHIAAKQRLVWAEVNVEKVESVSDIIIDSGARTQEYDPLKKIEDYEFALAWFETARELYDKTKLSKKKVLMDNAFKNYSDNYIVASEDSMDLVDEAEKEDILRRLDSAKRAEDYSWYLVTAFDSASSYALIKASLDSKDLSLDEAYSLLESKINEIDKNLSSAVNKDDSFVWARLYLDHAKYFLNAATFYKEQGYPSTALEKVDSGLSLVYLSGELFVVSDSIYEYYGSFTEKDYIGSTQLQVKNKNDDFPFESLLLYSAIILFTLILVVSAFLILWKAKSSSLEGQIEEIQSLKRKSDIAFFNEKISGEKHNELNNEYSFQLNALRNKIKSSSKHLIESEEMKEEAVARERTILDLKKLKSKKLISLKEFNERQGKLLSEEQQLKKASEKELLDLKKEKTEAIKRTKSLKDKSNKLISNTKKSNQKK